MVWGPGSAREAETLWGGGERAPGCDSTTAQDRTGQVPRQGLRGQRGQRTRDGRGPSGEGGSRGSMPGPTENERQRSSLSHPKVAPDCPRPRTTVPMLLSRAPPGPSPGPSQRPAVMVAGWGCAVCGPGPSASGLVPGPHPELRKASFLQHLPRAVTVTCVAFLLTQSFAAGRSGGGVLIAR